MRTLILAAALLTAWPTLAAETTYTRNCSLYSDGVNSQYNCTTSIERPRPPPEPFYRGPVTQENVRAVLPRSATSTIPAQPAVKADPNFCGPGFRYSPAEGCEPAK